MTIFEALTEFFGVVPIRSAVESELPNEPLVVVINNMGGRELRSREGLTKSDVTLTAYFRVGLMSEMEIVEMLHNSFQHYNTGGCWHWKNVNIEHGEQTLKSGSSPKMIPFEIRFDFYRIS